jgi:16S rRNA (guanine966-N2)-methyltransferase
MTERSRRDAVRIIAGRWRRRTIRFPDVPDLRPTPDRVRETLFNWLGQDLHGLRCLDLFAGSGALGFEAASRGAAEVVMTESNAAACRALMDNARQLDAAQVRIVKLDALEFLSQSGTPFDVVFLDPPFRQGVSADLLRRVGSRLAQGGRVYVESGTPFAPPEGWSPYRSSRAGQVHYCLIEKNPEKETEP